MGDLKMNPF